MRVPALPQVTQPAAHLDLSCPQTCLFARSCGDSFLRSQPDFFLILIFNVISKLKHLMITTFG